MNPTARRLLVAAAAAVTRKLLPDAVPDNPGSALALPPAVMLAVRPPIGELKTHHQEGIDRTDPFMQPSQTVYAPPPRRRRKVVTETITYEESEW